MITWIPFAWVGVWLDIHGAKGCFGERTKGFHSGSSCADSNNRRALNKTNQLPGASNSIYCVGFIVAAYTAFIFLSYRFCRVLESVLNLLTPIYSHQNCSVWLKCAAADDDSHEYIKRIVMFKIPVWNDWIFQHRMEVTMVRRSHKAMNTANNMATIVSLAVMWCSACASGSNCSRENISRLQCSLVVIDAI